MSTAAAPDPDSESGQIKTMRENLRRQGEEVQRAAEDVCKSKRLISRTIQESGKTKLLAKENKKK